MSDDYPCDPDDFETHADYERFKAAQDRAAQRRASIAARAERVAKRLEKRQEQRARAERRALQRLIEPTVSERLRALDVDASELFTQYKLTTQISSLVQRVSILEDRMFTTQRTEGGVLVTRYR